MKVIKINTENYQLFKKHFKKALDFKVEYIPKESWLLNSFHQGFIHFNNYQSITGPVYLTSLDKEKLLSKLEAYSKIFTITNLNDSLINSRFFFIKKEILYLPKKDIEEILKILNINQSNTTVINSLKKDNILINIDDEQQYQSIKKLFNQLEISNNIKLYEDFSSSFIKELN